MKKTKSIILAAGQGTRMHSEKSKVLHEICGDSLLNHVIRANQTAGIEDIAVIVGFQAEQVKESIPEKIKTFLQAEQLGTGHAVIQALPFLENFEGNVLILVGDAPLVRPETLKGMIHAHEEGNFGVTVLTALFDDPTGYGRIVKNGNEMIKIVEQKDATEEEKAIHEINSGMYCFDAQALRSALSCLTTDNAQHEYYLTDAIEIIRNSGKKAGTYLTPDTEDIAAVNSKIQLSEVRAIMQRRINFKLMAKGVTIVDPMTTYIDTDVVIGQDTFIEPGVMIKGHSVIGKNCEIGQNTQLSNVVFEDGVKVSFVLIDGCQISACQNIEPFTVIRQVNQ